MPSPTRIDDGTTAQKAKEDNEASSHPDKEKTNEDENKKSLSPTSNSEKELVPSKNRSTESKLACLVQKPVEMNLKRDSHDNIPSQKESNSNSKDAKEARGYAPCSPEDHKSEDSNTMNVSEEGNATNASCPKMKKPDSEIKKEDVEMYDVSSSSSSGAKEEKKISNDKIKKEDKSPSTTTTSDKKSTSEISAWANMEQPTYILPTERDVLLDEAASSDEKEGKLLKCDVKEIEYHPANVLLSDLVSLRVLLFPRQTYTTPSNADETAMINAATSIIAILKQGGHSKQSLAGNKINTMGLSEVAVRTTPHKGRFLKRVRRNKPEDEQKSYSSNRRTPSPPPSSLISSFSWKEATDENVQSFVRDLLRDKANEVKASEEDKFADADETTNVSSTEATTPFEVKQEEKPEESDDNKIIVEKEDVLLIHSHLSKETPKGDLSQQYKDHTGNLRYFQLLEENVHTFGLQNVRPCPLSSYQRAGMALSIVDAIRHRKKESETDGKNETKHGRFLARTNNKETDVTWNEVDRVPAAELTMTLLSARCIQADRHRRAIQKCMEGTSKAPDGLYKGKRKAKEDLTKVAALSTVPQPANKKAKVKDVNKILNGTTTVTGSSSPSQNSTPAPISKEGINAPSEHDVLFGRGGLTNSHIGNRRFRDIIALHRPDYISAVKVEKPNVARRIVRAIRGATPPGRFLKKNPADGKWYDVGDKHAAEKTSQALREKSQEERYRKATLRRLEAKSKRMESESKRKGLDAAAQYLAESRSAAAAAGAVAQPPMHGMMAIGKNPYLPPVGAPMPPASVAGQRPGAHPPVVVQGSVHPSLLHSTNGPLKHTQLLPHHPPGVQPGIPPPGYGLHGAGARAGAPPPHCHVAAAAAYGRGHPMPPGLPPQQPVPGPAAPGDTTKKVITSGRTSPKKPAASNEKDASPKSDKPPATALLPASAAAPGMIGKLSKDLLPAPGIQQPPVPPSSVVGLTDGAGNIIVTENDILCGRGGLTNHHRGNKRFRDIVSLHRPDYILASKVQKPAVSRLIVAAIRNGNPPGRFLKKDDKTGRWFDIGDKRAAEKASQALREKPNEERGGGRVSPGPFSHNIQQGQVAAAAASAPLTSVASGVPPPQPAAVVAQHPPPIQNANAVKPIVKKESPLLVKETDINNDPKKQSSSQEAQIATASTQPPPEKKNDNSVSTQSVVV